MVRIRTREGFWGLVTWALLTGCAWIGLGDGFFPRASKLEVYVLVGCWVAMLLIVPARDFLRAWRQTR
jgi:hypothetical protein